MLNSFRKRKFRLFYVVLNGPGQGNGRALYLGCLKPCARYASRYITKGLSNEYWLNILSYDKAKDLLSY